MTDLSNIILETIAGLNEINLLLVSRLPVTNVKMKDFATDYVKTKKLDGICLMKISFLPV